MNELARLVVDQQGGVTVARVTGEIDISNAEDIGSALQDAMPNSAVGLVLDLSDTRYMDSAGIRVLFDLGRRLRTRQQDIRAVVPEKSLVRRVLLLTQLDAVMPMEQDVDAAIAALKKD